MDVPCDTARIGRFCRWACGVLLVRHSRPVGHVALRQARYRSIQAIRLWLGIYAATHPTTFGRAVRGLAGRFKHLRLQALCQSQLQASHQVPLQALIDPGTIPGFLQVREIRSLRRCSGGWR